jgi:hypothetical protein
MVIKILAMAVAIARDTYHRRKYFHRLDMNIINQLKLWQREVSLCERGLSSIGLIVAVGLLGLEDVVAGFAKFFAEGGKISHQVLVALGVFGVSLRKQLGKFTF